jgi:hypothetical protein
MSGSQALSWALTSGIVDFGGGSGLKHAFGGDKKPAPLAPMPTLLSPNAGESTTLKPGEKVNLKNTGPNGLLTNPTTGRSTLLGG